jgi:hypothetical protein
MRNIPAHLLPLFELENRTGFPVRFLWYFVGDGLRAVPLHL